MTREFTVFFRNYEHKASNVLIFRLEFQDLNSFEGERNKSEAPKFEKNPWHTTPMIRKRESFEGHRILCLDTKKIGYSASLGKKKVTEGHNDVGNYDISLGESFARFSEFRERARDLPFFFNF